jgi:hypothetical protein
MTGLPCQALYAAAGPAAVFPAGHTALAAVMRLPEALIP